MRTAATHRMSPCCGQLSWTASAVPPSSTIRAEAAGANTADAAAKTEVSNRNRFIIGIRTRRLRPCCGPLFVAIRDSPTVQVVWRQLDLDTVTRTDEDVGPPHLARNGTQDLVPVVELDLEHRVWEGLDDLALHLDLLFLGHGRRGA